MLHIDEYRQVEAEFFGSIANLCDRYKFPLPDTSAFSFPQNIQYAFDQVKLLLEKRETDCAIMHTDAGKTSIATYRLYFPGSHFYYIPVRPLWRLSLVKERSNTFDILVCLFNYLSHTLRINYFLSDGAIASHYDAVETMIEEDMEDAGEQHAAMTELKKEGKRMYRLIHRPFKRDQLQELLNVRADGAHTDAEIIRLGRDFLTFTAKYPDRLLSTDMGYGLLKREGDEHPVYLDDYLSFWWSGEDCLAETVVEMANSDAQERMQMELPCSVQLFDTPQQKIGHDFEFEKGLFDLLHELIYELNEFDHE